MKWILGTGLGFVVLVALLGIVGAGYQEPETATAWATHAIWFAEDAVRSNLRDPDSAKFQNVRSYAGRNDDERWVCGVVNAKNGFGGYSGPAAFVAWVKVTQRHAANGDLRTVSKAWVADGRGGAADSSVLEFAAKWCRG